MLLLLLLLLKQTIIIPPDILISIIGVAAATLTTSSFLPEIIKRPIGPRAWETRINIPDMTVFATGTVLWMVYCIYKSDPMITGANAIATASNVVVVLLCMKFAYSKKSTKIV
jgi:MtN3 and saliva related transmembrane protein